MKQPYANLNLNELLQSALSDELISSVVVKEGASILRAPGKYWRHPDFTNTLNVHRFMATPYLGFEDYYGWPCLLLKDSFQAGYFTKSKFSIGKAGHIKYWKRGLAFGTSSQFADERPQKQLLTSG